MRQKTMKLLAVNYHYIRDNSTGSGIYPTSLNQLEAQITELQKLGYKFITQTELAELTQNPEKSSSKYAYLTFDDGLSEQMKAFHFLNKKSIPATFYVSAKPIRERSYLQVHAIHHLRSLINDADFLNIIESHFPGKINELKLTDEELKEEYRYDSLQASKLKYVINFLMTSDEKSKLIKFGFSFINQDEATFGDQLYMTKEDLKTLAAHGALGCHGDTHRPLATLSAEECLEELNQSLDFLNTTSESQMFSISYPYGSPNSVDQKTTDICKKLGLKFGVTMFRGINDLSKSFDSFLLKRIDTNDAPLGKNALDIF